MQMCAIFAMGELCCFDQHMGLNRSERIHPDHEVERFDFLWDMGQILTSPLFTEFSLSQPVPRVGTSRDGQNSG